MKNTGKDNFDDKKIEEMSKEISDFKLGDGVESDAIVFKNGDDYIVAIKGDVYKRENGKILGIDEEKVNKLISNSIERFKENELKEKEGEENRDTK